MAEPEPRIKAGPEWVAIIQHAAPNADLTVLRRAYEAGLREAAHQVRAYNAQIQLASLEGLAQQIEP